MSSYYRNQSYHSRKRALRRLRAVALVLLLVILVVGGLLAYDVYRSSLASDTPGQSTKEVMSVIASDTAVQSSPYFQFQTTNKWRPIANETKDGHYVYRQYNGPLVEQDFVVDVNRVDRLPLALIQTSRVMPIRIADDGMLHVEGGVSDHCKKYVPKGSEKTAQSVKVNQVTFNCNPDSTNYEVVVGVIGGTDNIVLRRLDGSTATYRMTYRNLMAQPSARDLDDIIETFEAR